MGGRFGGGGEGWEWGVGSVSGLGVGVLPLNDRINLFFSILVTFIFLKIESVCVWTQY